ncbi:MAG TPA: nuclear transport factor 2 family protein [Chryseosolibacter sp.]
MRLLLLLFLVATSSITLAQTAKVEKEVREMLANYFGDIRREGLMAEMKYLDNSADFFWVPPGYNHALSRDSVVAIISGYAPKVKLTNNSFETLRIVPLSDEIATYTGRVRSTVTDLQGNERTHVLVETAVVVKRKDGWKLLNGQTSVVRR